MVFSTVIGAFCNTITLHYAATCLSISNIYLYKCWVFKFYCSFVKGFTVAWIQMMYSITRSLFLNSLFTWSLFLDSLLSWSLFLNYLLTWSLFLNYLQTRILIINSLLFKKWLCSKQSSEHSASTEGKEVTISKTTNKSQYNFCKNGFH